MFEGIGQLIQGMLCMIIALAIAFVLTSILLLVGWWTALDIRSGTRGEAAQRVEEAMGEVWGDEYQLHKVEQHTFGVPDGEYVTWRNGQWYHVRPVDSPFLDTKVGE